jgi:hypothetical protein
MFGVAVTTVVAAVLGGSVGGGVGATPASAATSAPASTTREVRPLEYVGTIPKAVQREIATVDSVDDLARISPAARKVIQTPAIELIESGKASDARATYASGSGITPAGCNIVWVSRKRLNVIGWVLMSAKTTVYNWCHNAHVITSTPTVQRSMRAGWGFGRCGWDNAYSGWRRDRVRFAAAGDAQFALNGVCTGRIREIHSELQIYGSGNYSWRA